MLTDKEKELVISKTYQRAEAEINHAQSLCEDLPDGGDIALILDGVSQIINDRWHVHYVMSIDRKRDQSLKEDVA